MSIPSSEHYEMLGSVVRVEGLPTDDAIVKAKSDCIDKLCKVLKAYSATCDDLFIVKTLDGVTSVGVKIVLPTVRID
jgi:hypothetical protein